MCPCEAGLELENPPSWLNLESVFRVTSFPAQVKGAHLGDPEVGVTPQVQVTWDSGLSLQVGMTQTEPRCVPQVGLPLHVGVIWDLGLCSRWGCPSRWG